MKILEWVKSFAIFWRCATHFCNSGWFCSGHENDESHWTMRCWSRLILCNCYTPVLPLWLAIHGFRHTRPCQIVNVLATRKKKFLNHLFTVFNFIFTFRTTKIFWLLDQMFYGQVRTCIELVSDFDDVARSSVCGFQIIHESEALHNVSAHQQPRYHQAGRALFLRLEFLRSHDTRTAI